MKSSTIYKCVFKLKDQKMFTYAENAFILKDGFWLDENFQYDGGWLTGKYWVPPSQILYIEKETIEREE